MNKIEKIIEDSGVTSIIRSEYFNVNMNLDIRADVEISFEIDGKEYRSGFKYSHRNQLDRFTVLCNKTLQDMEDLRTGKNKAGIYLTPDEVYEDIAFKTLACLHNVTDNEAVLKKIETDDITVNVELKNIKINDEYEIEESIKEAYEMCVSSIELDVVSSFVTGLKKRLGTELSLFSIEMFGSSNRIILEGTCARVEGGKLIRRKGGLCIYSKLDDVYFEDNKYLCLLVKSDNYELVRYTGRQLIEDDMLELFKTDSDRMVKKLIIMEDIETKN